MTGWRIYLRRLVSALEKPVRSIAKIDWSKYVSRRRSVAASGSTGPPPTKPAPNRASAQSNSGNHDRRLDRTAVAELLGIWGALLATPTALVGAVNMSAAQKVIWTCVFAVDAAAVTALAGLLLLDRAAARRRRYRLAQFGFALIIPLSVG